MTLSREKPKIDPSGSEDAEHLERTAIDADLLSNCPVSGRIVEQVLQHVRTNHADIASGRAFTFGPATSDIDRHAVDIKHRDRLDAADAHVLRLLIGVLHGLDRISRDADTPARRTQPLDR